MKKGKLEISLKKNADVKKDKYLQGFLDQIKQAKTDKEKLTILDNIYSNGFEDGANEEKKTEMHVIVGIYSGVVNDVEVFTNEEDADKYERQLCKKYKIPYDAKEREEYYDSSGEHEIKHFIKKLH